MFFKRKTPEEKEKAKRMKKLRTRMKEDYTYEYMQEYLDSAAVDPDGIDNDETLGKPDNSVRIEDIIDEGK